MLDETLALNELGVYAVRGANGTVGTLAEILQAIRIGSVLRESVLIIETIDCPSWNKVGEALPLYTLFLNSGVSKVTREPRKTYTRNRRSS